MKISNITRPVVLAVVTLLVLATASVQAATPQNGVYIEVESEAGGQSHLIKLSMAADRMRMDTDQGVSLVTLGGDDGKMLMIQHDQRQYMELTQEMMEAMARMIGQAAQPQIEQQAENLEPPTFTRTGNTKQVGEWSAYEVLVEHPEQDDMIMWFSPDVDADFRTLAEQAIESMSSLLSNPMLQMGGGGGNTDMLEKFRAQMAAVDIPDGFPVQVISSSGGTQSTNTLRAIDQNASFGADTWTAPDGYTKMDLPFIR